MNYKGVSHIAFATGDLDRTIRFWRDLLGLRMVVSLGRDGYKLYFFRISEGQYAGFFEWPDIEPIEEKEAGHPVRGRFAFDHFALSLESHDDLWEIRDRLEAAGEWVSEVVNHGFIHSVYTFDPNGIALEFSFDKGLDLESGGFLCDQDAGEVAREGPDPQPGHWKTPSGPPSEDETMIYPGFGSELESGGCPDSGIDSGS